MQRVVLARENTLDDIRAIRSAVPGLGARVVRARRALHLVLRAVPHVRHDLRAQRESRLVRAVVPQGLRRSRTASRARRSTRGFLISAQDLAAHEHLDATRRRRHRQPQGRGAEEEARVRRDGHAQLPRVPRPGRAGRARAAARRTTVEPLVQIFSRGFTGGMYGGRAGRDYVTRDQPDNRGVELGVVTGWSRGELFVELSTPLAGRATASRFEPPARRGGHRHGFTVDDGAHARHRATASRARRSTRARRVPTAGASSARRTRRCSSARARATRRSPRRRAARKTRARRARVRLGGRAAQGCLRGGRRVGRPCAPRSRSRRRRKRALDQAQLREQLGRLGETPFALGAHRRSRARAGTVPAGERAQSPAAARDRAAAACGATGRARRASAERAAAIDAAVAAIASRAAPTRGARATTAPFVLAADVCRIDDARRRRRRRRDGDRARPVPPPSDCRRVTRVRALASELAARGVTLPPAHADDRAPRGAPACSTSGSTLGLPMLTGHLGLVAELARAGRDVVADYARQLLQPAHRGASCSRSARAASCCRSSSRPTRSRDVVAPWDGARLRRAALRPPGGDDDRALRALGRVRSRADDLPRPLRAEASERRAHRSRRLHVRRSPPTRRAATGCCTRARSRARSSCRGSGAAGIRGYQLRVQRAGRSGRARSSRGYRAALDALADGAAPPDAERARARRRARSRADTSRAPFERFACARWFDDASPTSRVRTLRAMTRARPRSTTRARAPARALRLSRLPARAGARRRSRCSQRRDTLVVLPTGGGKSLCYQVPALMLPGLTVVISPLISLMKDQVDALTARGLPATFVNSTLTRRRGLERLARAERGEIKLLYVAPERFDVGHHGRALRDDRRVAARGRRGALHQRVGPRLPPELPAHRAACASSSARRRPSRSRRPPRRDVRTDIVAQLAARHARDDHHRVRSHEPRVLTSCRTRTDADKDDALVAVAARRTTGSRSSTRRRARRSSASRSVLERARIPAVGVPRRPRRRRIATRCRTRS